MQGLYKGFIASWFNPAFLNNVEGLGMFTEPQMDNFKGSAQVPCLFPIPRPAVARPPSTASGAAQEGKAPLI